MLIYKTHTGKIYVDTERKLEFLTVGDYGKENDIKADFLGYHNEIYGVKHRDVNLSDKWVATVSTQKGCAMKCSFCDVHKFGFYGNCSEEDLKFQIKTIIEGESISETKRFNVHYARMGEPTFNNNVLDFTKQLPSFVSGCGLFAEQIHPVVSTMLPKMNTNLISFLINWCDLKNNWMDGNAGLQFSINSTSDEQRQSQFKNSSLPLLKIAEIGNKLPNPKGRKYTLNFAVTEETILNPYVLNKLFDKDKFIAKITPIHETKSAKESGFDVGNSYSSYSIYKKFEQSLLDFGWDVIVFVPSLEEDSDRITCGNALLSSIVDS